MSAKQQLKKTIKVFSEKRLIQCLDRSDNGDEGAEAIVVDYEEQQKFLHDIATPLAIAKTLVKRLVNEMNGSRESSGSEKQAHFLLKALDAVETLERLHSQHRARLSTHTMMKKSA